MSKFILSDKSEKKFINPSKAMANADRKAVVLKGTSLLLFVAAVILSSFALPPPQAKGQVLPCSNEKEVGFYYIQPMPFQTPMLNPSMSYDVMLGYIYADSILKSANMLTAWDAIEGATYNDTMRYVQKYRYILSDYDPMLFHTYLSFTANFGKNTGLGVEQSLGMKTLKLPNAIMNDMLLTNYYILHVKVNSTTVDSDTGYVSPYSVTVAYTTVLDKIKGQILPSLARVIASKPKTIESETNFVFEYCNEWLRGKKVNEEWVGEVKTMYDDAGNPWIMPNREYIVFVRPFCQCDAYDKEASVRAGYPIGNRYVYMGPIGNGRGLSCGMYPIKNGNVIDEGNYLGFGEIVPLNVFKTKLREQINLIKNFGN